MFIVYKVMFGAGRKPGCRSVCPPICPSVWEILRLMRGSRNIIKLSTRTLLISYRHLGWRTTILNNLFKTLLTQISKWKPMRRIFHMKIELSYPFEYQVIPRNKRWAGPRSAKTRTGTLFYIIQYMLHQNDWTSY